MALKTLAAGAALVAVAALSFGATDANAQTKKRYARAYTSGPNYSYMAGPRTRVFVTRRSWLDAGTEVRPGERKFTDYALAPGYSYTRTVDPRYYDRHPLSNTPLDLGGYPTAFPLY